jgi:hypothetical protein
VVQGRPGRAQGPPSDRAQGTPPGRDPGGQPPGPPLVLRGAAVVQMAETAIVAIATALSGLDTAAGRSYQLASGVALTAIGAGAVVALAVVAVGLGRARRWSRTPALLTQLFVGIVGIYLLQASRLLWGVPSVVLAAAGFAALLSPPSLRALIGEGAAGPQANLPRAGRAYGRKPRQRG